MHACARSRGPMCRARCRIVGVGSWRAPAFWAEGGGTNPFMWGRAKVGAGKGDVIEEGQWEVGGARWQTPTQIRGHSPRRFFLTLHMLSLPHVGVVAGARRGQYSMSRRSRPPPACRDVRRPLFHVVSFVLRSTTKSKIKQSCIILLPYYYSV